MIMEKVLFVTNKKDLINYYNNSYQRIYFGTEFCERRLVAIQEELPKVLKICKTENLKLSLVTPFVTEVGLNILAGLFRALPTDLEVIFNDWGVFSLLANTGRKCSLGRLLVNTKREPREPADNSLINYFKFSNLDHPNFKNFMIDNNISRVEIDNNKAGYSFKLPEQIKTSLYYPYVYITVSKKCITSVSKNKEPLHPLLIENCQNECREHIFSAKVTGFSGKLIWRGNAQFYENKELSINYDRYNIDRLVEMPVPPV